MISESQIFKALSDETRLRVLHLFLVSKGPLCVCEIVDALKLPQYGISKHLTVLKHAGIVEVEKRGLWGYYHLKTDAPGNKILSAFLRNYLTGETFQEDKRNLALRLLLREEGRCVVGFVSQRELGRRIKEKSSEAPCVT
jgi:ArsR family transcriptional regulator, arsenate/arsenite/antimonite-responsive transcriptional repressor